MPRRRKSKNQASEKYQKALNEAQDHRAPQATEVTTIAAPSKELEAVGKTAAPSLPAAEAIAEVATPSKTAANTAPKAVTPPKTSGAVPKVATPPKPGEAAPKVAMPPKTSGAAPKAATPPKQEVAPKVATRSKTSEAAPKVTSPPNTSEAAAKVATPPKQGKAAPKVTTPPKTSGAAPKVATPPKREAAPKVATPPKISQAAPKVAVTPKSREAAPKVATPPKTSEASSKVSTPPKTTASAVTKVATPPKTADAAPKGETPPKTAADAVPKVTAPLKTADAIAKSEAVGVGAGEKIEEETAAKNREEQDPQILHQHMYVTQCKGGAESSFVFRKLPRTSPIAIASISHRRPELHTYGQRRHKACFEFPIYRSPDDLESRVSVLEQFLMYKFKMKQVILKRDMINIISPEYEEHFVDILRRASERIEMVFAVNVIEVDPVIHAYDLVSKLKLPNNGRLRAGRGLPKTGLLMNVLGMIFMKGNRAKEEDIWKFLGMMKVYAGRKHSIFGEPRKLITKDLVKLEYLEYRQIPGSDPPSYEFLWGPKAHAETSKMQVLEFLARIYDTSPSTFLAQYEEALKDEEEKDKPKLQSMKLTRAPTPPDYAKRYLSISAEMNLPSSRPKKTTPP